MHREIKGRGIMGMWSHACVKVKKKGEGMMYFPSKIRTHMHVTQSYAYT